MTNRITESAIETFAVESIEKQGYRYSYGPDIAPAGDSPKLMAGVVRRKGSSRSLTSITHSSIEKQKTKREALKAFVEAIVISYLVKRLGTVEYPLGRKRYNKIAYLAHRKRDVFSGFVASSKIADIEPYVDRYGLRASLDWAIETFGRRKNDTLELLATVDFAALDLIDTSRAIDLENIRNVIATNTEWAPKLNRTVFSDANIQWALDELKALFPGWYAGDT